jgi:hypothetical protein
MSNTCSADGVDFSQKRREIEDALKELMANRWYFERGGLTDPVSLL